SYVAVNVSSPNTPGLRSLQDGEALRQLVRALVATSGALADERHQVPIAVKVAPDLTPDALAELVDVCLAESVSAIIATNTTLDRTALAADPGQAGGLSGRPLLERSLATVAAISAQAGDRLPIIGVGGIGGPDDARRFVDAGASLVQLYTALVYQGPGVVRRIARAIDPTPTSREQS
ncbi:MAG: quinone-dependent dihydroorotate dehydrogenase, partial [Angustibacter sp.]